MIFDDAGPVSKRNSSYARLYYSLLGSGSDHETRIVMATGIKTEGHDASWPLILDSLEELGADPKDGIK